MENRTCSGAGSAPELPQRYSTPVPQKHLRFPQTSKPTPNTCHHDKIRNEQKKFYIEDLLPNSPIMDQRQAQIDIDRLSDSDKRELQQSINNEMQKAKIQECTYARLHFPPHPRSHPHFPSLFLPWLQSRSQTTPPMQECLLTTHLLPAVHELTDICWKKCVTGSISSSSLDRKEEPCIRNCVERFLDANEAVLKHLNAMRGQGGM